MKNFKLVTILLSFLLLQVAESAAQTEGNLMGASSSKEYLTINNDASNHYSKIRFQTANKGWNIRNDGAKLDFQFSESTDWNDQGETMMSLDPDGNLTVSSYSYLENMRFLYGHQATGLKIYANDQLDWSMDLRSDGQMVFQNELVIGNIPAVVPGTVMTVDGRVHISPENSYVDAHFDENEYGDYLMWVDGGIVSEDISIADVEDWADFVFAPEYDLSSLEEIEAFILEYGHLPAMPAAADIKEGYTMHEMNKNILQVIEELTLHTIEQNKELDQLLQEVEKLEKK
jgi:hypothetical protein